VQDMSGYVDDQKVMYIAGSFVDKALMWWNSYFHTRGHEVAIGMTWDDFKTLTREEFFPLAGALTDEALRNGSIKKNLEKRKNVGEPSKDRNVKDDNKRTRTGIFFATTTHPVGIENMGTVPKCTTYNSHHAPRGQGRGNQGNHARGRAFMLGAEEARQDLNIVTGIEPSDLGFSYEIEIASRQLVEIDKLSKYKVVIIFHEKVVRIPLQNGVMLRVEGERPDEKVRHLRSEKAKKQKLGDFVMVRNFPKVFSDELTGLPPV
ncbi:hypothetical protein Tco_1513052, partial [Tanacetum coccineum]